MKIKDLHIDVDRYLKEDCYCPNEIYSLDGFFYQIVKQEDETKIIHQGSNKIIALWTNQLLVVQFDDNNKVYDITRVDATENNMNELIKWVDSDCTIKIKIDEFRDSKTRENLQQILSMADAIMVTRR